MKSWLVNRMVKKDGKKFSAFKLFYDQFIYKENDSISYVNVDRNINLIREMTIEVRRMSKRDLALYQTKLNRANKRIKEQLDEIYKLNKALFELYYLLYKSCVDMCSDKLEDMPFIISCSFYDDYRLDNKSVDELESSSYVVPKYSSLEKKEIRSKAKGLSKLEYFVSLIKDSSNANLFVNFIKQSDILMSIKPYINESYEKFFSRINDFINRYKMFFDNLVKILETTDDYDNVVDRMKIAYYKKFNLDEDNIDMLIKSHFDYIYNQMKNDFNIRCQINFSENISYDSFEDLIKDLDDEKNKLNELYLNGNNVVVKYNDNSYVSEFKEMLINAYFDSRFKNNLTINSSLDEFVDRAISLYKLSSDLENQLFDKVLYDSSHSIALKRNNDVNNAIIKKIYSLYNPFDLLKQYEISKNDFLDLLGKKDKRFVNDFKNNLNRLKLEYDYHGPIPTADSIRILVKRRQIDFVKENFVTELKSCDETGSYDTRNFDLYVLIDGLKIDEIVELYNNIKLTIDNIDFNNCIWSKDELSSNLQKFIVKSIFKKLNKVFSSFEDINRELSDICEKYLKEDCLFNKIILDNDKLIELI